MGSVAKGIEPVFGAHIEILILGSFPGQKSLESAQYYAHKQNQFWRLVGEVVSEPLQVMDYETRKRTLLKHSIGLWDVIGACERKGSLDSDIRNQRNNNFSSLLDKAKNLRFVCFNGKKAAQAEPLFRQKYKTIVLPSSSPAYTLAFKLKCEQWRQIAD